MTRPLRLHVPGTIHHITSRGNNKQVIFADDDDYSRFLELLAEAAKRFGVRCSAYCLMPNHTHLLLRAAVTPLSRLMQQLNSAYCQSFNRRHRRVGHVLQGRYHSSAIDSDAYFRRVVRYIVRNPVTAQCVPSPRDWPWSSHRGTAGEQDCPDYLDAQSVWDSFDPADASIAQHQFRIFVTSELDDGQPDGLLVGSPTFKRRFEPMLRPLRPDEDFVSAERFASRPALETLLRPGMDRGERDAALCQAFLEYAYTLKELSTAVGRPSSTVWYWIQRARVAGRSSAGTLENRDLTPESWKIEI